jgi:oligopeptide transport system substrate-binding protein
MLISCLYLTGCVTSVRYRYFGKTEVPRENILRYISGSEIESLDPQVSSGQPEARVYMAMFEGLVEYGPKDMQPIPALAEKWESSPNLDEFIFYIRKDAKFSDGNPITAKDFEYTFRRGYKPELLSRTAYLGYYIKNAEEFNSKSSYLKKNGEFLLAKDFASSDAETPKTEEKPRTTFGPETEFHKRMMAPERLVVKSDEKDRAKQIEANPKLKAALEGAELVPVPIDDIGVEAIDDYTLRISLKQSAPFFVGLLAHQFFRVLPAHTIEKYGDKGWIKPENYVTSGPFKLKRHAAYHELSTEKNQYYWDAARVKLDGITFYPIEEQNTMMNLYKSGDVDALYNHTVPPSWINEVRNFKDEYLDFPEVAIEYHVINVKKPPMDNVKVRQALARAIDREALAKFRKVVLPLETFSPEGAFPDYEKAKEKVSEEIRQEKGIAKADWDSRFSFNPEKACALMVEAGYKITKTEGGRCKVEGFPIDKVSITYNTTENNKAVQEFVQAQWKQNLGLTFQLKNMEWKTFLTHRNNLEYDSNARGAWIGDYMDPFTFLSLHYGAKNEGSTGWHDPKYDKMLDEANRTLDTQKRYEMMARAELYMLEQQPVIPLVTQATNWIKKPYVKGLYPNPGTMHAWKYVYLERDPAMWDADTTKLMETPFQP